MQQQMQQMQQALQTKQAEGQAKIQIADGQNQAKVAVAQIRAATDDKSTMANLQDGEADRQASLRELYLSQQGELEQIKARLGEVGIKERGQNERFGVQRQDKINQTLLEVDMKRRMGATGNYGIDGPG